MPFAATPKRRKDSMSLGTIVVIALIIGLIPAFIARHKGGPFVFFWFLGALLFPIGLVMALVAKDSRRHCPFCDEPISAKAAVCPHCQRDLSFSSVPA